MKGMKAVILVGGEGTRLRPLTVNTPKPMVPVVNRPFLEYMVEYLKGHHVDEVILALGYLPDPIEGYFGDGSRFGVKLTYVVEESPLGTAGAVKNLEDRLADTFIVFNGDIFTDLDLTRLMAFHRERKAKVTIALTPVENPTIYGVVETDDQDRVQRFIEKPSWERVTTDKINAGSYILEPEVLSHIPADSYFSFERGLFPHLLEIDTSVSGYLSTAYWIDIGTPESYLQLHHDLLMGKATRAFPGKEVGEGVWAEEGGDIHPSAQLTGPIVIGKNCTIGQRVMIAGPTVIGQGCSIGLDSLVEGAILWQNVHVGERVILRNCVIGDNSLVGDNTWVMDGSILGDSVIIGSSNRLEHGVRVWPGKTLEPNTLSFRT